MSLFERIANLIFRVAKGGSKTRWFYTPVVGFLFLVFLSLFVIAAILTDRWLNLPSINYLPWTLIPAIILLIAGLVLYSWTIKQFIAARGTPVPINPPQELITGGIYACSRNPMLTGIFLMFFGIGFLIGSLSLTIFYTPLLILILCLEIIKIEEKEMELKFGREYLEYKKRVPRFLPKISR